MNDNLDPQIQAYLESLLSDKGITVEPELKKQMLSDLNQRLQVRFQQIITEKLSVEDLQSLDKVAVEGPQAVQVFLRSKIPDIEQLFIQAMAEFRQAFLEG